MNKPGITLALISTLIFSNFALASSAKLSTLYNSLQEVNDLELSLAQKKTEREGAFEGELSIGTTKSFATNSSPETKTLDLTEGLDYISTRDLMIGIDAKQDKENDGVSVNETGIYLQKKLFYNKPSKIKKKQKDEDGDDGEPFYPSVTIKGRLGSGATADATKLPRTTKAGVPLPKLLGFKESNETLSLTWDFLESWSAGISYEKYQYKGFDKTQSFLYAHPGLASRLSGPASTVSSVVDHETILNIDWSFADSWAANLTETLQTDYVTGDTGTTTQIDVTWNINADWDLVFTANVEKTTAQPATTIDPSGSSAQSIVSGGLAVSYNF